MIASLAVLLALAIAPTSEPTLAHTELLADGSVLQIFSDMSVTITTVETVAPDLFLLLGVAQYEPGEVVYEWKNVQGVTCRARVDCVTMTYEKCVERALKLREIMQKKDPVAMEQSK